MQDALRGSFDLAMRPALSAGLTRHFPVRRSDTAEKLTYTGKTETHPMIMEEARNNNLVYFETTVDEDGKLKNIYLDGEFGGSHKDTEIAVLNKAITIMVKK